MTLSPCTSSPPITGPLTGPQRPLKLSSHPMDDSTQSGAEPSCRAKEQPSPRPPAQRAGVSGQGRPRGAGSDPDGGRLDPPAGCVRPAGAGRPAADPLLGARPHGSLRTGWPAGLHDRAAGGPADALRPPPSAGHPGPPARDPARAGRAAHPGRAALHRGGSPATGPGSGPRGYRPKPAPSAGEGALQSSSDTGSTSRAPPRCWARTRRDSCSASSVPP